MKFLTAERRGILYAISSGLCFGLLGYFGVTVMDAQLSVYTMLFWRFVVGSAVVALLLIPQRTLLLSKKKEAAKVFVYGILFYSTTAILYFIACKYISTGLAMVTFFTYPVMVILLNRLFYKTRIPKSYYGAVGLILLGLFLLGGNQGVVIDTVGLLLGVASAVVYAFYVIVSKKSTLSPLASTLMVSLGSLAACFVAAYGGGTFMVPQGATVWLNILALGTLCTALPILLLLKALRYISSEKASLLSVLEPVFVLIFGALLLDETVTPIQLVGVGIVLCGAVLTLIGPRLAGGALVQKWMRSFNSKER